MPDTALVYALKLWRFPLGAQPFNDQYIRESTNHVCPTFIWTINNMSTSFHPRFFQYTWSVYYQYICTPHLYAAALNCNALGLYRVAVDETALLLKIFR